MRVHPYLLARLYAVINAYYLIGDLQPSRPPQAAPPPQKPKLPNFINDEDQDDQGGGGGTMRGFKVNNKSAERVAARQGRMRR